jgi:type II secretory pathway component PulJ
MNASPSSAAPRAAFTILEVMFAVTFLAISLTTVVGFYQNQHQMRRDTDERGRVTELGRHLLDRIIGADARALGNPTPPSGTVAMPWSMPRYESEGDAPLSEGAAIATDDLKNLGLVDRATQVSGLQVWIEYYRGLDTLDPVTNTILEGVMDENFTESSDFRKAFRVESWLDGRRLSTVSAPYLQVDAEDPYVVRVIMTWSGQGDVAVNQRLEFFTVKRRPGGG